MKTAVLGDIHANLTAFEKVLKDAGQNGVEYFYCTGDLVDYGNEPSECVEMVRSLPGLVVQGNHDAVVCGAMGMERYMLDHRASIVRTQELVSDEHKQWLKELPLVEESGRVALVHGSMLEPSGWKYTYFQTDVEWDLVVQEHDIVFCGHTHFPKIHGYNPESGAYRSGLFVEGQATRLEKGWRYIINPGSVGQPRDEERASYLVYDDEVFSVELRRIAF